MATPHSRRQSRSTGNHQEEVLIAPPGSPTQWSTEQNSNIQFFSPRPPGNGESKRRKSSANRRPSLVTAVSSVPQSSGDIDPFARRPSRPSSSLSKYKPLPDIQPGSFQNEDSHADTLSQNLDNINIISDQRTHTRSKVKKTRPSETRVKSSEKRVIETSSDTPISKVNTSVKRETTLQKSEVSKSNIKKDCQDNPVIEIGVKLPETGDRVCQAFHSLDTLKSVMKFAQGKTGKEKLSQKYNLAINMPRKVFTNLRLTIKEAGLENKTILYLVDKDID